MKGLGNLRILEIVERFLPPSITLYSYLDTSEYHLFPSSEINPQLHNITIIDRPWPRFDTGLAESDVVEKGARRALHVLDVPLPIGAPEFAVPSTNHFGLEPHRRGRWCAEWRVRVAVTLRVPTNTNDTILVGEGSRGLREH